MKLKDSLSPIEGKNTELMEIVAKLKRKINYLEKKVIVGKNKIKILNLYWFYYYFSYFFKNWKKKLKEKM